MSHNTVLIEEAQKLLQNDPIWAAYAIADLDPSRVAESDLWLEADTILLIYHGIQPPHLFTFGDPIHLHDLTLEIPAGEYQYAMLPIHMQHFNQRLIISKHNKMWRMHLADPNSLVQDLRNVRKLTVSDASQIMDLFHNNLDHPDAFTAGQLTEGHFFGIEDTGTLVSLAGTHVVSNQTRVAAIGNVYTHIDHRGLGYAKQTTSAVCKSLLERGIEIIVLNVRMENNRAIKVYEELGFLPYCGYYEGIAVIN